MSPKLLVLAAPPGALVVFLATFALLEHHAAYRSPLAGDEPPAPREKALEDLEAWRRARAEEKARVAEILANLDQEKMVEMGKEIVHGRGLCFNCHRVGAEGTGTQGPDLEGVGARATGRVSGLDDVAYLTQSLYEPRAYVVDGYASSMTPANEPPIGLNDLDILMVVAYLQSLGGTTTVTPETELPQ